MCMCVGARARIHHCHRPIAESHPVSTPSTWIAAPLLSAASVADNSEEVMNSELQQIDLFPFSYSLLCTYKWLLILSMAACVQKATYV